VILLDIGLPVMDGFKTLEAIRREETLRHIPVIALTARAMKGDREQILGRGFDGYVSKPVDEPVLKEAIRKVLHGN
jgi:CheY-like chemotaxis protein